jgi:hypothetical protein
LERLSFGGHTTSYGVFGLGMLLIAFTSCAYVFLLRSKGSYIPLGFVGKNQRKADA